MGLRRFKPTSGIRSFFSLPHWMSGGRAYVIVSRALSGWVLSLRRCAMRRIHGRLAVAPGESLARPDLLTPGANRVLTRGRGGGYKRGPFEVGLLG